MQLRSPWPLLEMDSQTAYACRAQDTVGHKPFVVPPSLHLDSGRIDVGS